MATLAALLLLLAQGRTAELEAHDLHTSLLHLKWSSRTGELHGTLRVYADDLTAAARAAGQPAEVLVRRALVIRAKRGQVSLALCGSRAVADAIIYCLRGRVADLSGAWVSNTLLFDRFDDQVNVVRMESTRVTTLLLTRSARGKSLPR